MKIMNYRLLSRIHWLFCNIANPQNKNRNPSKATENRFTEEKTLFHGK